MILEYTRHFELLLKDEGEKAECLEILHRKASSYYLFYSNIINIPVIILSSFIGLLTAVQLFPHANIILGSSGILVSILKTIDSYFDLTKKAETHRLISLRYSKISKLIQMQLSIPSKNRIDAKDFYNLIINDLSNLKDSEPSLPLSIIEEFKKQYEDETTSKPPFCNGLTDIKIIDEKESIEMKRIFSFDDKQARDAETETEMESVKTSEPYENIDTQIEKITFAP